MNIKKSTFTGIRVTVVLAVIFGLTDIGMAQQPGAPADNPAYLNIDQAFDFSKIEPTVNVNMPKFLLDNMLSQLDGGAEDPFGKTGINIADLTRGIELIRVVVFEVKDPEMQKVINSGVEKLKKSMSSKWMPIVNVPDGNVTVFAMGDETGKRLAGLAMMVNDKNSAVIGNIVGEVQIGKIIAAAGKMASTDAGVKEAIDKLLKGMQPPPPSNSKAPAPAKQ